MQVIQNAMDIEEDKFQSYKFFDKKSGGSGVDTSLANKSATEPNYQLANKLHKQIIKKFKR